MKQSTKGFSLSELLIVVIVIGILAAVVLPRYNKSLETRKTTEAENIMEAVRTEQERRCALSKTYAGDIAQLTDIVPNATTGNFTYSVSGTGVLASSQGSYNYTLKIPSYADGRICCDGDDCSKLNKDYPTCDDLINNTSDYDADTTCLSAIESEEGVDVIQGGGKTLPEQDLGDVYEAPDLECRSTTSEFSPCPGGCAIRWRHCQSDNTWGDWGECDASEVEPREVTGCGCKGLGSRTQTCEVNATYPSGHWVDSGECSREQDCECNGAPNPQQHMEEACGCLGLGRQYRYCDNATGLWKPSGEPSNLGNYPVCKRDGADWGACECQPASLNSSGSTYQNCGCGNKGRKTKTCREGRWEHVAGEDSQGYGPCLKDGAPWLTDADGDCCTAHFMKYDKLPSSVSSDYEFYETLPTSVGNNFYKDRYGNQCRAQAMKGIVFCNDGRWVRYNGLKRVQWVCSGPDMARYYATWIANGWPAKIYCTGGSYAYANGVAEGYQWCCGSGCTFTYYP